jgi:hypothetical protein
MIESIQFLYDEKIIVITLEGQSPKEYTNRADYIAGFPERAADCDAIGWP